MIMIWLGGQTIGRFFTGPLGSPGYPLFLLTQPALVLVATVVLGRFLVEVAPNAAKLLSGGRLRGEPKVRPVLATA